MNRAIGSIVLGLMSWVWAFTTSAQCASTAELSCNVYPSCFAKYCNCTGSPDEYLLQYGKRYCDRFLAATGWTAAGQKWRDRTLRCLQERIVPNLSITDPPTQCDCKEMRGIAFKTHVECYVGDKAQPDSFCQLPTSDLNKIRTIVEPKDAFGSKEARQQFAAVAEVCIPVRAEAEASALLKIIKTLLERP